MSEVNWIERLAGNVARGITGYGGSVLPILGATFLAVAPFVMPKSVVFGWALVGIGIVLTLLGVAALIMLKPNYWALRRENAELESKHTDLQGRMGERERQLGEEQKAHKTSLVAMLNHVARRALNAAAPNHARDRCRISVYVERDEQFVLVARWSQNERLRRPGRSTFPMGQGVIGQAWDGRKGAAYLDGLKSDPEEWILEQCAMYGFDEATARAMTMKSRSIAAVRVDGERKTPILVVESLDSKLAGLRATYALKDCEPFNEIARIISDADIIIPEVHETFPDATSADMGK